MISIEGDYGLGLPEYCLLTNVPSGWTSARATLSPATLSPLVRVSGHRIRARFGGAGPHTRAESSVPIGIYPTGVLRQCCRFLLICMQCRPRMRRKIRGARQRHV